MRETVALWAPDIEPPDDWLVPAILYQDKIATFAPEPYLDDRDGRASRRIAKVHDYSQDEVNTKGLGRRRTVEQVIGKSDAKDSDWVEFEQTNRVNARWVFRREVSRRYKPALMVMDTDAKKFDAKVGVGSSAYQALSDDAAKAVDEYLRTAVVKQQKPKPYVIGDTLARVSGMVTFKNALHEGYDGLNDLELRFARAIDETGLPWARNRSQTGYRIPLVSLGSTVWFFPDFLIWSGDVVYCVDTKNQALVEGDSRRKLLTIRPHKDVSTTVEVRFVTDGTWKADGTLDSRDGYSVWSLGSGQSLRTDGYEGA